MKRCLAILCAVGLLSATADGQPKTPADSRVEKNVLYGMYSGLALLMDVHYPAKPNRIGIIYVGGNAFHHPLTYDATPLKDRPALQFATTPLLDAGYTVFVINHRAAPRFRHPAALEDAHRAVRFVRHHANRFGIRQDRIGAAGHSSGAYLALMLGVLDGHGVSEKRDAVDVENARVQAVAAQAPPTDFVNIPANFVVSSYLGVALFEGIDPSSEEYRIYRDASPVFHATKDDAPTLLVHGDADPLVPFRNSELMNKALLDAGVAVSLVPIRSGGHFPPFPANEPDPYRESVKWFDEHLLPRAPQ
jgi:acetyl esterase/lipase